MQNVSNLRLGIRDDVDTRASRYIAGVYTQMCLGVLLTALSAYALITTGLLFTMLQSFGSGLMWGVFLLQLGTIMAFRPMSQRMAPAATRLLFFFYAAITGITVAAAATIFTMGSLLNVFATAALSFGGLAMFGHITKKNLGWIGTFCLQALWMLFFAGILFAVASYFPAAASFLPAGNITLGLVGVLVFSGLTAYEAQKLREVAYSLARSDAGDAAIGQYTAFGALNMYLNFINLFFSLLRLMGRRR